MGADVDRTTKLMLFGAVIIWAAFFGIRAGLKHQQEGPARKLAAEAAEENAENIAAIAEAETWVRARLKDPYSAVFSDVRVVGRAPLQRVCGQVNAKNSFGAYEGEERFTAMTGWAYLGNERPGPAVWDRKEHPCDAF